MVGKSVIVILQEYLRLLQSEGIWVDKAFLYGSYLNKTERNDSDIDLMIVSRQFDNIDDSLVGKIWSLTKKVNSRIEPFIVGMNKFETDDVSPIIQIVKKEGMEILK